MRDNKNFFSFCILVSSRAWFLLVCFVVLFVFPVHAQDSGQLSLSPSRVSFSSQGTETQSAPKTVRVTNRGDGVLSFPRIFLREDPSGSFALRSGCSLPLESGESCELEVTFAPAESGVQTGTIEIQSSAGSSLIALRGTGVGPKISLSPRSQRYRTQAAGELSELRAIRVQNRGKGLLRINQISREGAQASEFIAIDDCRGSLEQGDSCQIEVQFAPSSGGRKVATLQVTSNAGPATVTLSGDAVAPEPKLSRRPSRLSFANQGVETESLEKLITVTNAGTGVMQISGITVLGAASSSFRLSSDCPSALAPDDRCEIAVVFIPEVTGVSEALIRIQTDGGVGEVELKGVGAGPKIRVSPSRVRFPKLAAEEISEPRPISISNTGKGVLRLTGFELAGGDTSEFRVQVSPECQEALQPKDACDVEAEFLPLTGGQKSADLVISSNAGPVTVTLQGSSVQPEPKVRFRPSSLRFSNQGTGTESFEKLITLTNVGTGPLIVNLLRRVGSDREAFSQANDCGDPLQPDEDCTIEVVFAPPTEGNKTAALEIETNAGLITVALSGAASGPRISLRPTSLRFVTTAQFTEGETRDIAVRNSGRGVLRVSAIRVEGAEAQSFQQENDCEQDLDPGLTCFISVIFSPRAAGVNQAELVIESNTDQQSIFMTGEALGSELRPGVFDQSNWDAALWGAR